MPVYVYKGKKCNISSRSRNLIMEVSKCYRFDPNLILSTSLELFRAFLTNRCLKSSFALGLYKTHQDIRSAFFQAGYEHKSEEGRKTCTNTNEIPLCIESRRSDTMMNYKFYIIGLNLTLPILSTSYYIQIHFIHCETLHSILVNPLLLI